ncbi:MAG TPA: sigma-70 family RNA polymerase sigma factor [Planctomycetota bacterium]|nr:sigma-70 family RNA polymerase sigma factor [Planctomycetota bacterium]
MDIHLPGHDLRLSRRAANGEPDAWREIVDRFGARIHSLALHFSRDRDRAQDLTQEIFLRMFQHLGSYRGDVPLMAWTLRLSRNLCIDDYRRRRLERGFRFLPLESVATLRDASDPAAETLERELRTQIEAALAELDLETALILTLRDVQGLSYQELEALLGLPSGTVKSRIHRGRRDLARRLELHRSPAAAPAAGRSNAYFEVVPC